MNGGFPAAQSNRRRSAAAHVKKSPSTIVASAARPRDSAADAGSLSTPTLFGWRATKRPSPLDGSSRLSAASRTAHRTRASATASGV